VTNPDRSQLAALGRPVAVPGVHFPSASDDEALGRPLRADAAEDLDALRRVSDAAIGDELFRRREARTPTGAT
jgi:hypothetical protein